MAATGTGSEAIGADGLSAATVLAAVGRAATGSAVGFVAGAVIGGVGGRLAMLLLRLTSDSSLAGVRTDDDFEIGSITGDTLFLVGVAAFGGAVLGFAYVATRRWLPAAHRPVVAAVVLGAIGGAAVIEPGGVDFTLLEPLWFAVALFIALPAAFGAALAWGVERAIPRVRARRPHILVLILALAPVLLTGPAAALTVLGALGWAALRQWPGVGRLWWSPEVTVAGRALGVAGTGYAAAVLAQDASAIL
ncbi:MAG TPA: hypothetical protein VF015_09875 [Acidimicrobiales bacterium]